MTAFIYRHPLVYRLVMTSLYRQGYHTRYRRLAEFVPEGTQDVIEYCFGDTALASMLESRGSRWYGIDSSEEFVQRAIRRGFDAHVGDAASSDSWRTGDVLICQGSFYHFKSQGLDLLQSWIQLAPVVILSEPTTNLASSGGLVGRIARWCSRTGKDVGVERFTQSELEALCYEAVSSSRASLKVIPQGRDTLVVITRDSQ